MARRFSPPTREDALKVARYLGCRGVHQDDKGNWMPCSNPQKLSEISNRAESDDYLAERKEANPCWEGYVMVGMKPGRNGKMVPDCVPSAQSDKEVSSDDRRKRRLRRASKRRDSFEQLGERGVLGIDTLEGGGLVSGKMDHLAEHFEEHELIDLKAESYTKPNLREQIKKRIMAGSRGGKPGQWSARKAQLLAIEYRRAGGGYRGQKKKPQRSLDKWTREEWTTSDGKPAIREGGTNRYLPKKAWAKLTPSQRDATNRKKRRASQDGRQFVANTERARQVGRSVRNLEKSIIIGRAKPRRGDPDVFDNPDAARLRSRTLGCIGIARRETPDGEVVWTPCTNVSDFRRRTGQGVLGERDEIRRLQRRLREVGGPSLTRARERRQRRKDSGPFDQKALQSLANLSDSFIRPARRAQRGIARIGRRVLCRNRTMRDGDGDGFICNPKTGKDDLPVSPEAIAKVNPNYDKVRLGIIKRQWNQIQERLRDGKYWREELSKYSVKLATGNAAADQMIRNAVNRGFLLRKTSDGYAIEAGPVFQQIFWYRYAAGTTQAAIDNPDDFDKTIRHTFDTEHGVNVSLPKHMAEFFLHNFGYDAHADVMYDVYSPAPSDWAVSQNKGQRRKFDGGIYEETKENFVSEFANLGIAQPSLRGRNQRSQRGQTFSGAMSDEAMQAMGRRRARGLQRFMREAERDDFIDRLTDVIGYGQQAYGDKDPDRDFMSEALANGADNPVFDDIQKISDLGLTYEEAAFVFNVTPDKMREVYEELGDPIEPSDILQYLFEKERLRGGSTPEWFQGAFAREIRQAQKWDEDKMGPFPENWLENRRQRQTMSPAPQTTSPQPPAERQQPNTPPKPAVPNPVDGLPIAGVKNKTDITPQEAKAFASFVAKNWNNKKAMAAAIRLNPRFAAMLQNLDPKAFEAAVNHEDLQDVNNAIRNILMIRSNHENIIPNITRELIKELKSNRVPSFLEGLGISVPQWHEMLRVISTAENGQERIALRKAGLTNLYYRALSAGVLPPSFGKLKRQVFQNQPYRVPAPPGPAIPRQPNVPRNRIIPPNAGGPRVAGNRLIPPPPVTVKTAHLLYVQDKGLRSFGRRLASSGAVLRGRRYVARAARFDLNARDGDGDNVVQEGTIYQRPAGTRMEKIRQAGRRVTQRVRQVRQRRKGTRPASKEASSLLSLADRLKEPNGGFTFSIGERSDLTSGYAIARRGQGIKIPVSRMYDKDGRATEEGVNLLLAFINLQKRQLFESSSRKSQVALGAWHNPDDGQIYLDVTDVFSKKFTALEQAVNIGAERDQISLVDLDELQKVKETDDWDTYPTFYPSGGSGAEVIDPSALTPYLEEIIQKRRAMAR